MRLIDADELFIDLAARNIAHNKNCFYYKDAIEAVENAPTVMQWIPCSDKLPYNLESVLAWSESKGMIFAYCDDSYWIESMDDYYDEIDDVVAWMKLPEDYEENKHDKH